MKITWTIPNLVTCTRLLAVPILAVLMIVHQKEAFQWLLLYVLVSDILDGLIARVFHMESEWGAYLDSMADTLTYVVVSVSLFLLQGPFISAQGVWVLSVLAFYVAEKIKCFFKYGKWFNAFHTYSAKAMGYIVGIFVLSLYFWGFLPIFFILAIVVGVWTNLEDMILSSLLKTYEHDVKGLWWVLKRNR